MIKTVLKVWHHVAPKSLLYYVRHLMAPEDYKMRSRLVLNYYKDKDPSLLPDEVREGIRFLKRHKFTSMPFYWTLPYEDLKPQVHYDAAYGGYYADYSGKKLYFKRNFTQTHAMWAMRSSLREQDERSAHRYLTPGFQVEPGSIVVDAGVAEGNFALSVVDQASKLYLIECDPEWVEALRMTFAPWKDKVVIVEKFLSGTSDDKNTTLDELLQPVDGASYFVKMDVEGYEKPSLAGAQKLLQCDSHVRMDVCTYHYPKDEKEIRGMLESRGFHCETSDGYILFFWEGDEPCFRKALIRADNRKNIG